MEAADKAEMVEEVDPGEGAEEEEMDLKVEEVVEEKVETVEEEAEEKEEVMVLAVVEA